MSEWNEADHPRDPSGVSTGGQFVEKATGAARRAAGLQPEMPAEYKRNEKAVATVYEENVQRLMEDGHMTREEAEQTIKKAINCVRVGVTDQPLCINRQVGGAEAVLESERFKTQLETGESGGYYSPGDRAEVEKDLFGYPKTLPPSKRPVYGYVGDLQELAYADNDMAQTAGYYGPVTFVLKDEVRVRTTTTFGDSLGREMLTPSLIDKVDIGVFGSDDLSMSNIASAALGRAPTDIHPYNYYEIQMHGGVTLADVDYVILRGGDNLGRNKKKFSSLIDKLDKKGVRWVYDYKLRSEEGD